MNILTFTYRGVNSYLVETKGGWVLIDTGYEQSFSSFRSFLRKKQIDAKSIQAVLLTHSHAGHAGFVYELLKMTKADVYLSEAGMPALLKGRNSFSAMKASSPSAARRYSSERDSRLYRFTPVPLLYRSRLKYADHLNISNILLREYGIRVLPSPGHTADSLTYWFDTGEAFCGDAVMHGLQYRHHIPAALSDQEELVRTWQSLLSIPDAVLYPGRGEPFSAKTLKKDLSVLKKTVLYEIV